VSSVVLLALVKTMIQKTVNVVVMLVSRFC